MSKLKLTQKSADELYDLREIGSGVVILKSDEGILLHLEFYISKGGSFVDTSGRNLINVLRNYEKEVRK